MSKVKSKIRKGKQVGREEEETRAVKPEQGTDLLCCVPAGQGTVVSFHILIARQLLKVIHICAVQRYIVIIVLFRQAILSAPRESLKIPTQQ